MPNATRLQPVRGAGIRRIVEPVSNPWFSNKILRFGGIVLYFLSQHPDVGSKVFQFSPVFRAPYRSQQLRASYRNACVLDQNGEHIEFFRREMNVRAVLLQRTPGQAQLKRACPQNRIGGDRLRLNPAKHRTQPSHQFSRPIAIAVDYAAGTVTGAVDPLRPALAAGY